MMQSSSSYIRIGTTYYKLVNKPLASGDFIAMLLPWSVDCIKQDHGRDYLSKVTKYDGFCFVPSHLNYQRSVGDFYNKYHPFAHKSEPGDAQNSLRYLQHIFGDQLELGLDYLKLLLEKPMQRLPILCLVSSERNTGKTTFLNWLKAIFTDNMTINTNEDFRSNFNAEWAQKVIIGVDETFLERREDSERLKNLSTATYYKVEAKGMDRQETEFFGKFILCSNNEDNFVIIDPGETRYWIRKIPVLSNDNPNLLAALKKEIPKLLHLLGKRKMTTIAQSRMWFTPQQIETPALRKLIRFNRMRLEVEIAGVLLAIADEKELTQIRFTTMDLHDWLNRKGVRGHDTSAIKRILQNVWNLKPAPNSNAYTQFRYGLEGGIYDVQSKGRFYQMDMETILKHNDYG